MCTCKQEVDCGVTFYLQSALAGVTEKTFGLLTNETLALKET